VQVLLVVMVVQVRLVAALASVVYQAAAAVVVANSAAAAAVVVLQELQAVQVMIKVLVAVEPTLDATDTFERYLAECIISAPVSTIRGGTTQVLRTLIARRLLGSLK